MSKGIESAWDETPIDVTAEVNMIWSIANKLRGTYQSDKYKNVIPMTIIRRFECALASTKRKIVENGSPLFTGGVSSGESQVRRWLLENDYLEAIIALPTDLFYNTGIATYIWILSKDKLPIRKGKDQLIDATTFFKPLRKSLGNKRNEITPEDRKRIVDLNVKRGENEFSQIHANEDFMYREYTVKSAKLGTKDTERVPFTEDVDDYMAREVLPHVPDAVATFEENLAKKKPVIKTGAEFPFTRYFYKYEKPRESAAVLAEIVALQQEIERGFKELAG